MHTLNILVIEDHQIVAHSVAMIIEEIVENAVVTQTGTFTGGLELLHSGLTADLILLDVGIPGGEFYGMIGKLRNIQPDVRILIFTAQEQQHHAIRFLSEGANGFLSKNAPLDQVGIAVKQVLNGQKYMSVDVQQKVAESFFNKLSSSDLLEHTVLSPRENEVLNLLLEGKWIKEIALELNLKLTTVSTHKTRIFEKMQVKNIIELFKKVRLGEEV